MVKSSSSSLPAGVGDEKMKDDILIRDCHTELVEVLLCSQKLRSANGRTGRLSMTGGQGTKFKVEGLPAVGGSVKFKYNCQIQIQG